MNITGHSPFTHFSQLEEATEQAIFQNHRRFVHFGWGFHNWATQWGADLRDPVIPYLERYMPEMWQVLAKSKNEQGEFINPNANYWGRVITRPGAIFAVHKDRMLANPPSVYQELINKIQTSFEFP